MTLKIILARQSGLTIFVSIVAVIVGMFVASNLSLQMAITAALTLFCVGLWASAAVPVYWTAFAFFFVAVVSGVAPPQIVFSGFQTSTFWLLFSGLILSSAIRHTGLGQRGAVVLTRYFCHRYVGTVTGICLFAVALAFVMPSAVGRIVMLVPIISVLAEHMGYGEGSNGRTGLLAAASFGTFLPAFAILPANVPNMMLVGMSDTLYSVHFAYADYLLLHFPVLGLLKAALLIVVIVHMFPDHDPVLASDAQHDFPPFSAQEWRLIIVLLLCLAFWLTDGVHHIPAGWIGLAAALACLWPQSGLCPDKCLRSDINYGSLFFIAGIMGLGAVISSTGLGEMVVQQLTSAVDLSHGGMLSNLVAVTGIGALIGLVTSMPGMPSVMTPVASGLASVTGLPLDAVLMAQVLAFSSVVLPYQAPPLMIAMQIGKLPHRAMARLCLILFVLTVLLLLPLDAVWWKWFGPL